MLFFSDGISYKKKSETKSHIFTLILRKYLSHLLGLSPNVMKTKFEKLDFNITLMHYFSYQ